MLMLSYVALRQGDSVGMITFSDEIHSFVPPRGGMNQMNRLLHASFDRFPQLVESRYDQAFRYLASHCRKRSLVVLVTNVIDEVNANQIERYLTNLVGRHLPLGVLLRDRRLFDAVEAETSDTTVALTKSSANPIEIKNISAQEVAARVASRINIVRPLRRPSGVQQPPPTCSMALPGDLRPATQRRSRARCLSRGHDGPADQPLSRNQGPAFALILHLPNYPELRNRGKLTPMGDSFSCTGWYTPPHPVLSRFAFLSKRRWFDTPIFLVLGNPVGLFRVKADKQKAKGHHSAKPEKVLDRASRRSLVALGLYLDRRSQQLLEQRE